MLLKRLMNPLENDSNCVYVGNLTLAVLMDNAFYDNSEDGMLTSLLFRLSKSSLPSTNQGIIIVFALHIIDDIKRMSQFLSNA